MCVKNRQCVEIKLLNYACMYLSQSDLKINSLLWKRWLLDELDFSAFFIPISGYLHLRISESRFIFKYNVLNLRRIHIFIYLRKKMRILKSIVLFESL